MTNEGLELIKEFEGFREEAYLDVAGVPTIGYGTTLICGYDVQLGMKINKLVAELFLRFDLDGVELEVRDLVHVDLEPHQFDALISFHYNTGGLSDSTLLRFVNQNLPIPERLFTIWNKAHVNGKLVEVDGLTRRRKAEFELYDGKRV